MPLVLSLCRDESGNRSLLLDNGTSSGGSVHHDRNGSIVKMRAYVRRHQLESCFALNLVDMASTKYLPCHVKPIDRTSGCCVSSPAVPPGRRVDSVLEPTRSYTCFSGRRGRRGGGGGILSLGKKIGNLVVVCNKSLRCPSVYTQTYALMGCKIMNSSLNKFRPR